jgi:hypothetical protein
MIRWYISPYAGDGTPDNPYHAAAWDLTNPVTDNVTGMFCPQKSHYIVRVKAPQGAHDAIVAQGAGKPIGPIHVDEAAEDAALDSPLTDDVSAIETDGYSTAWLGGTNTLRDLLRYAYRVLILSQLIHRTPVAERIFELGLGATVADLTTQQRNAVRDWMTNKGLATGWITNSTTIRQVLHYIVTGLGIGKIKVAGKEF